MPLTKTLFRNDAGSQHVSFSEGDRGIVDKITYQDAAEKVAGMRVKMLYASQEVEFYHEYYNDELEISIQIVKVPRGLEAANLALGRIVLVPTLADQFHCDHGYFTYITFFGNGDRKIVGFQLNGFGDRTRSFVKR